MDPAGAVCGGGHVIVNEDQSRHLPAAKRGDSLGLDRLF